MEAAAEAGGHVPSSILETKFRTSDLIMMTVIVVVHGHRRCNDPEKPPSGASLGFSQWTYINIDLRIESKS